MDWKKIYTNKTKHVFHRKITPKKKDWKSVFSAFLQQIKGIIKGNVKLPKNWKFSFHKRGQFIVSYVKNNTVRSHVFGINQILGSLERHKYVVAGFILVISGTLLVSALPAKKAKTHKITANGVGGGEHEGLNDKDEAFKDDLLKMETEVAEGDQSLHKREYIVKSGDTLSEIAKNFNVSVESIAGSSDLQILDHLSVGQKLYIPNKDGFFYNIKKDERLANVLDKYKVTYDQFINENPNINPDLLAVGQEVFLPGAKPDNLIRAWLIPVTSRVVTSGFGWRRVPRHRFHKGLDLKANYTSVRAAKGGTVVYAGRLGGYGKVIIIAHPGGYKTLYAHLSKIYVRKGIRVVQGSTIARSGNTGYSTGPHLHFEVTRYGKHINPRLILTGLRYRKHQR